jgi:hypothetical protein
LREERSWPTQTIVTEPVRRVQVGQFAQALDRVEYLLRNCGYLAERKGDCVVLSDNAHWLDFRDLAPWLPFRADALETFPWVREFSRRGSESCKLGPERFLERVHGYKFPARGLDGLVAYLVKALSAVGVITNYSCAGHVGFLVIGIERGCSSAWSTILIRDVEAKLRLRERWQVENGMLYVPRGDHVDWVEYFLEVLDVADLLYQERIRLREIRREIALQMDARAEQFAFESILLNMDLLLQQVS